MRNFKLSMGMLVLFALLMTSCSKEDNPSSDPTDSGNAVSLKFGALLNDLANRAASNADFSGIPDCSDAAPATAELEISYPGQSEESKGTIVVDILHDDSGYFTDYSGDLKIPVSDGGSVTVTLESFLVYDASHTLIWAAPVGDGEFTGYVDQALPFDFEVRDGTKPYISVDVLCFDRRMVNEYGYPFFDIIPNMGTTLCFFANYCDGRHYVANYSLDVQYWTGTEWIDIYSDESPMLNNTNHSADPLCLLIPDSPLEDSSMNYLRYRVTPLSWDGYYGSIDETPTGWIELSWDDVEKTFNDDGSSEYIHLFLGCDIPTDDCQGLPTPGDRDGDCVPDEDDDCPDTYGTQPNGCMPDDDCIGEDPDGDGVLGDCDACKDVAGPADNNGCPLNDCVADSDSDGVLDCDDQCPFTKGTPENNGCPEDEEGGTCETAYMFGDTPINSFSNSNKWGWAEDYMVGNENQATEFKIYAGAGQNEISKGTWVGTATVTVVDGVVNLDIDMEDGYTLDELHVNLTDSKPSGNIAKAPGQYNMNSMVDAETNHYEFTNFSYTGGDFWIIVHTVTCGIDE